MSQLTEGSELAQDGETSDDAVMTALAAKREESEKQLQQFAENGPAQEGAEGEEEEQADPDKEEAEQPQVEEFLEFELDGKPVKVNKSDLPKIYRERLLEEDYRRKTAEIGEAKRTFQQEQERIQEERSHYANRLDTNLALFEQQLIGDQAELAKLAESDPAAWVSENAKFQQRVSLYQQAVSERQALAQRQRADQQKQHQEWATAEREALRTKLPEWSDESVAEKEQLEIAKYLLSQGYPKDEVANLQDHRALLIARDAAKWQAHQKATAAAKAKQVKPEPGKPLKPGAAKPTSQSSTAEHQDAMRRLRKTGSDDDALALLQAKRNK